mmetsp:Transcript_4941/g.5631  ORF Transcript_4941/g.5631 Transcript_4941/m.5631 type:complete len:263 (+) Transcript_4941:2-790(+)
MSEAQALRVGIPASKWVYLHGCADTYEKELLKRPKLHRSPAMKIMGEELEKSSNLNLVRDIKYRDIYSCFPIAVSVLTNELGIVGKHGSDLTLTGGLPYHGGPGSNYSLHGVAALVSRLRADRGSFGLITANGGLISKHSGGIYGTTPYSVTHPNASRWTRKDPRLYQEYLNEGPEVPVSTAPAGMGRLESYTVIHKGNGKEYRAICIGRLNDSNERFVAICNDDKLMKRLKEEDYLGHEVHVATNDSGLSTFSERVVRSSL